MTASDAPDYVKPRSIPGACVAITLVISLLTLAGWALRSSDLRTLGGASQEMHPALAICFIGTHTYAIRPATADRGEALELFDPDGCGRIVGRVLPLLSMLAMSLHGAEGERLIRTVHADLVLTLDRLWKTIAAR